LIWKMKTDSQVWEVALHEEHQRKSITRRSMRFLESKKMQQWIKLKSLIESSPLNNIQIKEVILKSSKKSKLHMKFFTIKKRGMFMTNMD